MIKYITIYLTEFSIQAQSDHSVNTFEKLNIAFLTSSRKKIIHLNPSLELILIKDNFKYKKTFDNINFLQLNKNISEDSIREYIKNKLSIDSRYSETIRVISSTMDLNIHHYRCNPLHPTYMRKGSSRYELINKFYPEFLKEKEELLEKYLQDSLSMISGFLFS